MFLESQKRQYFKKKAPSAKAKFFAPKALSKAPVWRKSAKYGDTVFESLSLTFKREKYIKNTHVVSELI